VELEGKIFLLLKYYSIRWFMKLYDHYLANKAYFSDITVENIYQSFTHNMAAKVSWH